MARYPYTDDLSTSDYYEISAQLKQLPEVPFEVIERSSSSLTIYYEQIPGASAYMLEGFEFEGEQLVNQRLDLSSVEFVNLIPGTQYKFKLAGVAGNEKGPVTEFSTSTIPGKVKGLKVETGLSFVNIEFQKGEGRVINYEIEVLGDVDEDIENSDGNSTRIIQTIKTKADSLSYSFKLDELTPNTEYTIGVTGHTPTFKGQTSRVNFRTKNLSKIEQVISDIDDFEIKFKWFSEPGSFRIRAIEVNEVIKSELDLSDFVKRNSRKPRTPDNLQMIPLENSPRSINFNSSVLIENFASKVDSDSPEQSVLFSDLDPANLYAFEISRKVENTYFPVFTGIESTTINPPQDVKLSKLGNPENSKFLVQFDSPVNSKNIESYKIILKSAESGTKLQQQRIAHSQNVPSYSFIFKDGELANEVTAEVSAEAFGRASNAVNATFEVSDGISLVSSQSDGFLLNWPVENGNVYKIAYSDGSGENIEIVVNSANETPELPFKLGNLKANIEYEITLLENDEIMSETRFLTSPLLIQEIKLKKATETSVTVSWESDYDLSEISGFVINVFEFKSNKNVEIFTSLPKSETQYTIENLKSGTQYSVQIQIKDKKGDVGPPIQNYVGTKPGKIETDQLILEKGIVDGNNVDFVNIRWDRLEEHESVAFYEVRLSDVESGVLLNERKVDAGQEDITYEGLGGSQMGYEIEVKPVMKLANGKMVKGRLIIDQ